MVNSHRGSGTRVKIRFGLLMFGAIALAGCSWMPHFGKSKPPVQETLMKSLTGEVDFSAVSSLPPDAKLEVTLSDVSRQDAPARVSSPTIKSHRSAFPCKLRVDVRAEGSWRRRGLRRVGTHPSRRQVAGDQRHARERFGTLG
jgi:hypothetical protein